MVFKRSKNPTEVELTITKWQQRYQQLEIECHEAQLALKRQEVLHRQTLQTKEEAIALLKADLEKAEIRIKRAREEARNAKERAKRLKRREARLLALRSPTE